MIQKIIAKTFYTELVANNLMKTSFVFRSWPENASNWTKLLNHNWDINLDRLDLILVIWSFTYFKLTAGRNVLYKWWRELQKQQCWYSDVSLKQLVCWVIAGLVQDLQSRQILASWINWVLGPFWGRTNKHFLYQRFRM